MNKRIPLAALLLALVLTLSLAPGAFAVFPDTGSHWAARSIDAMAEAGVILGFPDGSFRPQGTLSRAQFLTMCVRYACGEPTTGEPEENAPWWKPYTDAAEAANWGLTFEATPEEMAKPITRQEMAVVLGEAANQLTLRRDPVLRQSQPVLHSTLEQMTDRKVLEDELADGESRYYSAMDQCIRLGLLTGYPDGECKPLRTLTRAEAATVLCRLDAAKTVWEQGGEFVVFTDSLKIWQTWGEDGAVTIHSTKDGAAVSEITAADRNEGPALLPFAIVNANGKYFWGECGLYEYDESGAVIQLTDLPAIDYGYDASDGSIVFLTHDPATRVVQTLGGAWVHAADSVARLHADGSVEVLLTAEACGRITKEGEVQPGLLVKVDRAANGEVWVVLSNAMGMTDQRRFRVVISGGEGVIVPTGLAGNGYSY